MQTEIEMARHRLWILHDETQVTAAHARRVTAEERHALAVVLDELHRMNEVANQQRKEIADLQAAAAKKK